MLSNFLKDISILKKFLFINLLFFSVIGIFTILYLKSVQPSLINSIIYDIYMVGRFFIN